MGTGPKCEGCALYKSGAGFTKVEIGAHYGTNRLLLVGEASGEAEARESLPFRPYAQSGSLLSDAMRQCNIMRSEVAITNIVRCRPPKDWLEGAPWAYNAISNCTSRYLIDTIQELKPNAILALGGTAFRNLTSPVKGRYGTLDYARGYVVRGAGAAEGIPVIATYHPAHLRRGAAHLMPLLQRDLRRAFLLASGRMVEGKHYILSPTEAAERGHLKYLTMPSTDEAQEWYRNIDPDLPIVVDIETSMSSKTDEEERVSFAEKDIKLAQFTQRRNEGISIPFRDEYIDVVKAIMRTPNTKVTHNGYNFDQPVMEANGIEFCGEHDDTMVMWGVFWSDLPRNLQACAQMAGFPMSWKHLAENDLELYGAIDVDATLAVYHYLRNLLQETVVGV